MCYVSSITQRACLIVRENWSLSDYYKSALLLRSFNVLQAAGFLPWWLRETSLFLNCIAYPVFKAGFTYRICKFCSLKIRSGNTLLYLTCFVILNKIDGLWRWRLTMAIDDPLRIVKAATRTSKSQICRDMWDGKYTGLVQLKVQYRWYESQPLNKILSKLHRL
jgi:hypothetical protein